MSRIIDELNSVSITIRPLDSDGDSTTPTTARYRIDDCRSETELVGWTDLTPAAFMFITIAGSVNAIINTARLSTEVKTVTVEIDKDLDTQQYSQYTYQVKNLGFAQIDG